MTFSFPTHEGEIPCARIVMHWLLTYGPALAYDTLGSLN